MASRYHPLFGGLWSSVHLEGLPFEGKGFFAYLCSNDRVRPSGIYRVTDAQLSVDTELPEKRVRVYLDALAVRGRIVRDGAWIFLRGYLERQPKHGPMLKGAENDIAECTSIQILKAFGEKYPHLDRWSTDRLATLRLTSVEGQVTVTRPINENRSTDADAVAVAVADAITVASSTSAVADPPWGRPDDLVTLYNRLAPPGLCRVARLSPARRDKARNYLAQFPDREFWVRAFSELRLSRFLQGQRSSPGHESFRGDFDWLLSKGRDGSENVVKVSEGKYRDQEA